MSDALPAAAVLVAKRGRLDFFDSQSVPLPRRMTAITAWNLVMSQPLPGMALAFGVRHALSAPFGVKRIGGFSGRSAAEPRVGAMLDFFLVEQSTPETLVLTARDKHLDVMTCVQTAGRRLTITSSVVTHNAFGRAYMLPVAPVHRFFVARMLVRAARAAA